MPDPASIAREYFEAFNRRDWVATRALLDPEYSYTGRDGKKQVGPDAAIANSQMYATRFPKLRLEIVHLTVSDTTAVVEYEATVPDEERSPGRPVPLICAVLEVRDGRIHAEREYWQRSWSGQV